MISTADCPRTARIRILLEGRLDTAGQREMAEHLDHCATCQAKFEELANDSAFLPDVAREYSRPGSETDGPMQQMIEELGQHLAEEMTTSGESKDTSASDVDRPDTVRPPESIGPYEIVGVIGRGGMGQVFKARDPRLNRTVALKVLAPHLAANALARKRFLREARSAAAIRNDHVVTIHAVDDVDGFPFLVMEFMAGGSLAEHLERHGALPVEDILQVGLQVARAIAAAHAVGIIHRDLKPANILLEQGTQRIKIADFGLARAVDDVALTQTGCIGGTPPYMSPEQARDENVDHRSDLFSLGSVLYAMCTGRAPFRAASPLAVIRQVCDEMPPPIRQVNPDCPQWLVEIVERLMAKDPVARWQSADEVVELLERHLVQYRGATPAPLPTRDAADNTADSGSIAPTPAAQQAPPPRWPLHRLLALAAAALVAALGVVIIVKHRGGDPTIVSVPNGSRVTIGEQGQVEVELPDMGATPGETEAGGPNDLVPGERQRIVAHDDAVNCLDISSTGDRLVSAAQDGTVRVWDTATWQMLHELIGHRGAVLSVRFMPDGKFALSAGEDHSIRMWDIGTGRVTMQFTGHTATVRVLALAEDGQHFYSGGADGQIIHWHIAGALPRARLGYARDQPRPTPRELGDLEQLDGHVSWVRCLALSPDQRQLASGGNEALLALWDVENKKIVRRLIRHLAPVSSVAFTADGKLVVSAGFDNEVCVWKPALPEPIYTFEHPAPVLSLATTPSSRHVVTACEDGVIRYFDLSSGKRIAAHTAHAGGVLSIVVAPAGDKLFSAGQDKTIRTWQMPADVQEPRPGS